MYLPKARFSFSPVACALLAAAIAVSSTLHASAQPPAVQPAASSSHSMAGMSAHMYMTALRPVQPGDQQRADIIVAAARQAMEPYRDYRKALADGYRIFLPNVTQPQYHFSKAENGRKAQWQFDPLKPTSLLYKKNADGGYTLVGAMYTDRVTAGEDELNQRVPLSIAQWHQHVNFCRAPLRRWKESFGPNAKFGALGSIHTREECEAEGGTFLPHVLGWMVHVYPYETDPKKVWSVDDDDQGHDNMDHSSMPGMKMN